MALQLANPPPFGVRLGKCPLWGFLGRQRVRGRRHSAVRSFRTIVDLPGTRRFTPARALRARGHGADRLLDPRVCGRAGQPALENRERLDDFACLECPISPSALRRRTVPASTSCARASLAAAKLRPESLAARFAVRIGAAGSHARSATSFRCWNSLQSPRYSPLSHLTLTTRSISYLMETCKNASM